MMPVPINGINSPTGWFHKMDHNGDGFVSRREFIGSPEEFDKIDKNHDGLISPEEAEEYEAERRQKTEKK